MGGTSSKGFKWLKKCDAEAGFSPEEVEKIFKMYDKNNDNVLDQAEAKQFFYDYLKAKGHTGKEAEIQKLFAKFDVNGDGTVSWDELNELAPPGMDRYKSTEEKRQVERQRSVQEEEKKEEPQVEKKVEKKVETKEVPTSGGSNLTSLSKTFAYYNSKIEWDEDEDPEDNLLFGEGLQAFMDDLGIEGAGCMIIMWKLNNVVTGELNKAGFERGFRALGCRNFQDIKRTTTRFVGDTTNNVRQYETFYKWVFDYLLDSDSGVKTLETDIAKLAWLHVFGPEESPHWALYPIWKEFVETKITKSHISRDEWEMLWEMQRDLRTDLSNVDDCDEDGCWPTLCDDFMAFAQERQ